MPAKRVGLSPVLCLVLSALFWQRAVFAALPPVSVGSSTPVAEPGTPPAVGGQPPAGGGDDTSWWEDPWIVAPRIGWYGYVGYQWQRNDFAGTEMTQQGMIGRLGGRFKSFLWQPWFGTLSGDLRLNLMRDNSLIVADTESIREGRSQNMSVTGNVNVGLLHRSRIPFNAYITRDYGRAITSQEGAFGNGYLSQRFGFSQRHTSLTGAQSSLDWGRGTQSDNFGNKTSQDSLQLTFSHTLDEHSVNANASRSTTEQKSLGQSSSQNNVVMNHSFTTESDISFNTSANIASGNIRLPLAKGDNTMMQVGTVAFWRPEEEPITVMGNARVLTLNAENTTFVNDEARNAKARVQNLNLSLGVTYQLSSTTQANGSVSSNLMHANGQRTVVNAQTAGLSYSPEERDLGNEFMHRWSTSATASNQTGGQSQASRLALQLSQSLNRRFQFDESVIVLDASQSLTFGVQKISGQEELIQGGNAEKQISHSAGVAWSTSDSGGDANARLSVSDSRQLGGGPFFQMINLQLSGNFVFSANSSLSGNLSIQATRQGGLTPLANQFPGLFLTEQARDWKPTSNGSIVYSNRRLFGIRGLGMSSALRMNSQALLPTLGGPDDQEMAAFDTNFDYIVGRMTLRLNALIAQTVVPIPRVTENGILQGERETQINKSIMFTVTRDFGS